MNTCSSQINLTPSSSFLLDFEGTNYIPTITMLAHAQQGELNHSNNPTYIEYGQNQQITTGSTGYIENSNTLIKNMVSSSFVDEEPDFKKTTYISKIAIYDEQKNLIGVAKLANPVRKRELDSSAIFVNRIKAYPRVRVLTYSGSLYYNNDSFSQDGVKINDFLMEPTSVTPSPIPLTVLATEDGQYLLTEDGTFIIIE
jgi:hypothetical protein